MSFLFTIRNTLVLLAAFTFFAAWNREINILYIMFSLLVATLILSHLLPRFSISRITAQRDLPAAAFEGNDVEINISIRNNGWLRRYMLEVVDHMPAAEPAKQRPSIFIGSLRGKKERRFSIQIPCHKRGLYHIMPPTLRSGYPIGLSVPGKQISKEYRKLLVYPEVFEISAFPHMTGSREPSNGVESLSKAGGSEEFFGIREYQHGDGLRRIHWPSTARQGQLITKEFELRGTTTISFLLDGFGKHPFGDGKETPLEYSIKISASVARFAMERGHKVQLLGSGKTSCLVPPGNGFGQMARILETLAVFRADGETPYPRALSETAGLIPENSTAFLFFQDRNFEPEEAIYSIDLLVSKRIHVVGIFFDPPSFSVKDSTRSRNLSALYSEIIARGFPAYWVRKNASLKDLFV